MLLLLQSRYIFSGRPANYYREQPAKLWEPDEEELLMLWWMLI
jgi:hypothetical protein